MCFVSGKGAWKDFKDEAGGHRWQRVPPTETKGRRHSSTFTVAVFRDGSESIDFDESDVKFEAAIGHGPGGQHKQKTASAIKATHVPTGITAYVQNERSQHTNKRKALETLRSRVTELIESEKHSEVNNSRQEMIGSGERSDKIRTVQEHNGRVVDHRTGKKCSVSAYLKGDIWKLR